MASFCHERWTCAIRMPFGPCTRWVGPPATAGEGYKAFSATSRIGRLRLTVTVHPANPEPYYQLEFRCSEPTNRCDLEFWTSPPPQRRHSLQTKIPNCVDTGPAAKMLIPKADRKAIHEVCPFRGCVVAEKRRRRPLYNMAEPGQRKKIWLTSEAVPLP